MHFMCSPKPLPARKALNCFTTHRDCRFLYCSRTFQSISVVNTAIEPLRIHYTHPHVHTHTHTVDYCNFLVVPHKSPNRRNHGQSIPLVAFMKKRASNEGSHHTSPVGGLAEGGAHKSLPSLSVWVQMNIASFWRTQCYSFVVRWFHGVQGVVSS